MEPEQEDDRWPFGIGAYLFAANTKGVTTVGPKEIETDLSFDEAFDSLEGAFSIHFEALSPARIGIGVDYLYTKIGKEDIETPLPPVIINDAEITLQTFELFGYDQYKYLNFDHKQETDIADFGYDATEQGLLVGFGLSF